MVKDTTNTFFQDSPQQQQKPATPQDADRWLSVAEKGIKLFETVMAMKQAREGGNNANHEQAKYEKGFAQGQQIAQQQIQQPKPAEIHFKSQQAKIFLFDVLSKLDKEKTIADLLDNEIKQYDDAGMLEPMISSFLKEYTEVKQ